MIEICVYAIIWGMNYNVSKSILIFPPLENPSGVQLAVPTLSAQLKYNGFDTEIFDLNIDFFQDILSPEYLEQTYKKIDDVYNYLKTNKETLLSNSDMLERELISAKIKSLERFYSKGINIKDNLTKYLSFAINTMRSEVFYNTKNFRMAEYTMELAMSLISLPYSPISFKKLYNIDYFKTLTFDYLKKIIFSEDYNIFLQYFKNKLSSLYEKQPDFVGISIGYESQILAGLTIAYLIKTNTNAHVSIGGSLFTRKVDVLKQYPEFFDLFSDSVMVGEGDKAIVDLVQAVTSKSDLSNVPNLVYKKDGQVVVNTQEHTVKLSQVQRPDFEGYDFKKYFSPEPMMPIEIQRSCDWGKCSFCDINYKKTFSRKSIDQVVEEIEFYKSEYNIKNFVIVDSTMTPDFLNQFADKLLEKNIKINFLCDMRFHNGFTLNILKKAYKSGLKCICWGIESVNSRISKLMNKNFDKKLALNILKLSDKAGIWNTVYLIAGFPTEMHEEMTEDIDFAKKHKDIIHCVCLSKFVLLPYTKIFDNYDYFGIDKISSEINFNTTVKYTTKFGMSDGEINGRIGEFNKNRIIFFESAMHNCYYSQMSQCILRFNAKYIKSLFYRKNFIRKINHIKDMIKGN